MAGVEKDIGKALTRHQVHNGFHELTGDATAAILGVGIDIQNRGLRQMRSPGWVSQGVMKTPSSGDDLAIDFGKPPTKRPVSDRLRAKSLAAAAIISDRDWGLPTPMSSYIPSRWYKISGMSSIPRLADDDFGRCHGGSLALMFPYPHSEPARLCLK